MTDRFDEQARELGERDDHNIDEQEIMNLADVAQALRDTHNEAIEAAAEQADAPVDRLPQIIRALKVKS